MGLDKANIFKLSEEEFTKYKKDPFLDCFESTKDFAEALKNDIDTKETPHSLLLSADYGMGKTFFSTRFTQYLRNNRYDVIYFSVWENDYMQEPFLAFSKVILNYIHNKFKAKRYKDNLTKVFRTTEKVVESFALSTGIGFSISAEKLINAFKAKTDPIIEFKKQLTSFVKKIPKNKFIIIVDELDRCRPDYAMKTLECIKHFFDIEGLFVILPTNKEALNDCIKSLYGIDNTNRNCRENYFQKFFNDERVLKRPIESDYLYIVNQYLTNERLTEALTKGLLSESENVYNNITLLRNWFATYSFHSCLTVRELKDFSIELARICNNFYEPIRAQWLACVMAHKNVDKDFNFKYPLPTEHCFYKEHYTTQRRENIKDSLLNLSNYSVELRRLAKIESPVDSQNHTINANNYRGFVNKYHNNPNQKKKYDEVHQFFNNLKKDIIDLKREYHDCYQIMGNLNIMEQAAINQYEIIKQYQNKYGSDDNDDIRESNYQKIIDNPELLYSIRLL